METLQTAPVPQPSSGRTPTSTRNRTCLPPPPPFSYLLSTCATVAKNKSIQSEILFPLVKEIVEMSEVEITAYPPVKPGQKVGRRAMIAAGKTPHRNNVNKGDKTPWMAITPVDGRLRRTKPMPLKPRSTRYNYYSYSSGHAAPSTQPLDIQPNNNRSDRAPYSVTPLSSKVNLF